MLYKPYHLFFLWISSTVRIIAYGMVLIIVVPDKRKLIKLLC